MEFCPECNNLLRYTQGENCPLLVCKDCGFQKNSDKVVISTTSYKKNKVAEVNHINYIYDPTLPRTIFYDCPNSKCETKKNPSKKEAITFNKEGKLKRVYICKVCLSEWHY